MTLCLIKNPITLKRISRFKEIKRAYFSFWALLLFYGISLFSELVCNDTPMYVRYQNKSYFPTYRFYSEDEFTGNGKKTRADYKAIRRSTAFQSDPKNMMIFPPIPYGPYGSVDPASLVTSETVTLTFNALPWVGSINISNDFKIVRSLSFGAFIHKTDREAEGDRLDTFFHVPDSLKSALKIRFENRAAPNIRVRVERRDGVSFFAVLSTYMPRKTPSQTVRVTFRESFDTDPGPEQAYNYVFDGTLQLIHASTPTSGKDLLNIMSDSLREDVMSIVSSRFLKPVEDTVLTIDGRRYHVFVSKKEVQFPFPPTKGHIMGIDGAGRDVSARILYGLRTSLTFGFLLVLCAMFLGVFVGSVQGYLGGFSDIAGQRLIEIWSALPFLYIMILMGSIYGRSFPLLLFCYGIFNWVGISYYVRAEFLKLRKLPFVETAKCMGISSFKIIFKHILPNAMVPVITFFPFSLVGAIGALAALDYLGFGLPPPIPSWGELLFQAQTYRWAWWLILYPSLALFVVMLLGVFIGEGIRNAYDPKRFTRWE